jgi:hypothetical protein
MKVTDLVRNRRHGARNKWRTSLLASVVASTPASAAAPEISPPSVQPPAIAEIDSIREELLGRMEAVTGEVRRTPHDGSRIAWYNWYNWMNWGNY